MLQRFILGSKQTVTRDAYIWNMIGGMLNACQSALLLIIISHTNTVEDAGVFAIAYAIASLTISLGKYGMRNFQASDVSEKYAFNTYVRSRWVTSLFMMVVTLYYVIRGFCVFHYDRNKIIAILLVGLLKLSDTVEDVYHGRLQQRERLDIAAKCLALRYIGLLLIISVVLIISHNFLASFFIGLVFSWVFFLGTYLIYAPVIKGYDGKDATAGSIVHLLMDCSVIAAGGYLSIYIANAPKYAIDAQMTESVQAGFNYIFMPVYIVSTLSTFIFQPLITKIAYYLEEGKKEELIKLFLRITVEIAVICVVILAGGYLLGIPALSVMYNYDLSAYKKTFMILLLGGGFLAFGSFFSVYILIMRRQKRLVIGYIIPAAVEFFAANEVVKLYGINGVSVLYTGLMLLQSIIFLMILLVECNHLYSDRDNEGKQFEP